MVIALIDMRRRAQAGFQRAGGATSQARQAPLASEGNEMRVNTRKRPWEARGLGMDWILEQDAARAARDAALRRRVSRQRGVARRELMSEPSRPPHARTRQAANQEPPLN